MGAAAVRSPSADPEFVEEPAFSMPSGPTSFEFTADSCAITANGHGVAFLARADDRMEVLWDGRAAEPFSGLVEQRDGSPAVFTSDDGAHIAYVGDRHGTFFVGRDDIEYPAFEAYSHSVPPVFSHGGAHLAYAAGTGNEYRLLVDGDVVSTMPVAPVQAVFSPSGDRIAYTEMREGGDDESELRIVIDGAGGPWFRGMRNAGGAMQFSPDSQRFAYHRIDGKGHVQWVVDGRPQRLTDEVRSIGLAQIRGIGIIERAVMASFSPDSQRFAYAADVEGKGVAVVEDDVAGPRFKRVGVPVWSPDSRHLAYVAETYSKTTCLVVDGVVEQELEWQSSSIGEPVFSSDSRRVAVAYLRKEGGLLRKRGLVGCLIDGRVLGEVPGDDYRQPMFSPDGDRIAWLLVQGDHHEVMVDGSAHAGQHLAITAPLFSSGGQIAYAVAVLSEQRVTIMVDGRLGPLADDLCDPRSISATFEYPRTGQPNIPFRLSPDGGHVAWGGIFGGASRPVLDATIGPPFDLILDWTFAPDGQAVWWAQRADTVYRVTSRPATPFSPLR